MKISITKTTTPRQKPNMENLPFGQYFSDHMFVMDYAEGKGWYDPRIVPYGPISLDPSAMVFHYAQEIFEGLKAYKSKDGGVRLFRPYKNFERLNVSGERLAIPPVDVELCVEALKQLVWLEEWSPAETPTPIAQAQRLRRVWDRFCFEGSQSYIVLDAWQYGDSVLTSLMGQPVGGGRPLCCYNHTYYSELELEGAIPVIYPIKAGGTGTTDPDSDMILNAELQFEHGNVQLLTGNMNDGVEAYKKFHRIKDDSMNYKIAAPYKKTNELIGQIQNLREEPSGAGIRERRISVRIQRDSWSALKYALRFAQILERVNLQKKPNRSDWSKLLDKFKGVPLVNGMGASKSGGRMVVGRHGGRKY